MAKRKKNNNCPDVGLLTEDGINDIINFYVKEMNRSIEEMLQSSAKIEKRYIYLSQKRDKYTLQQAAFRLNCDRHTFEKQFIYTGKIRLHFIKNRKYVLDSEIKSYMDREIKNQNLLK